jgi:hypothetical protein
MRLRSLARSPMGLVFTLFRNRDWPARTPQRNVQLRNRSVKGQDLMIKALLSSSSKFSGWIQALSNVVASIHVYNIVYMTENTFLYSSTVWHSFSMMQSDTVTDLQRMPLCTGNGCLCAQAKFSPVHNLWLTNAPFVISPQSDRDCSHNSHEEFGHNLYTSMSYVDIVLNSNTRQVYCYQCGLSFFEQNPTKHNTNSLRHAILNPCCSSS